MPIEPTGTLSIHLHAVESLLSLSAAFQAWAGAAGDTERARDRIHVVGVPPPAGRPSFTPEDLAALRPFAIVNFGGRDPFAFGSIARQQFVPQGRIEIALEQAVPPEDKRNLKESVYDFLNAVGPIAEQMMEAAEGGGYPVISRVRLVMPPVRADEHQQKSRGDFLAVMLSVEFGLSTP